MISTILETHWLLRMNLETITFSIISLNNLNFVSHQYQSPQMLKGFVFEQIWFRFVYATINVAPWDLKALRYFMAMGLFLSNDKILCFNYVDWQIF